MSELDKIPTTPPSRLSLDVWAVIIAFTLTALVRFGVITRIPW